MQTKELELLIKRSIDVGNGWREVSDFLWNVVRNNADPRFFETKSDYLISEDKVQNYIRIKPLLNQIRDWQTGTKEEISLHDRKEVSIGRARNLFTD